jgi:bleomycin hydrolase
LTQTVTRPPTTDGDAAGALAVEPLRSSQAAMLDSAAFRVAQNAVARNNIDDVALNQRIVFETDHTFSTLLDDWGVTNQKQTGRCWMFAGLNLLRFAARRKLDVKEFEFSQNFLMF